MWSQNPSVIRADVREHCAERNAPKIFSAGFGPETYGNSLISLFSTSDYPRRASSNLRRRAPKSFNTGGSKKKKNGGDNYKNNSPEICQILFFSYKLCLLGSLFVLASVSSKENRRDARKSLETCPETCPQTCSETCPAHQNQ